MKNESVGLGKTLKFALGAALCAAAGFVALAAHAADADVTGLVPTIWWDFETQLDASGLPGANKGSASISFTSEGNKTYAAGAIGGTYAIDTSKYTPYSGSGSFSTAGNPFTLSLVMTLGTNPNGITLNVRTTAGDLIIRRGATEGSLVVAWGAQQAASSQFLNATFADGDAAYHLVSIVGSSAGTELYIDGVLDDSSTAFTPWSASGKVTQMQFGGHLNGTRTGESKNGGLIDDLRIHDAALTSLQMMAIAVEYGIVHEGFVRVHTSGEPSIGKDSFSTRWTLVVGKNDAAEAAIVYGTDAALSSPTTNALGSALLAGDYTASLAGLDPGTTYWWKIVASNGVNWAETPVASFRTLDMVDARSFTKRIPVTVSGYAGTETLANFPVLVRLAADAPTGFDYADCATDGSDLRFAAPDGTMLSHEIESWNTNGTSYVWVKVPSLAGTTTAFDLFYGADPATLPAVDPTDVWTRYAVVIHGGDALANAVGNGLAVAAGSASVAADPAAGKAGGGIRKSAYNAKGVNVDEPTPRLSNAGRFSVSGWFNRDGNGGKENGNGTHILMGNRKSWNDNGEGFVVLVETGTRLSVSYKGGHTWTTGTNLVSAGFAPGNWGHVAFSYDKPGSRLVSYLNGIQDNESGSPNNLVNSDSTLAYWTFGSLGNNSTDDCFRGDMDELRVFNGFASGDWIRAEYDSVADPAAFAALGAAEPSNPDAPRISAPVVDRQQDGSFLVTVEISENEPVAGSVACVVGGTSFPMTTSDIALPATYAAVVSGIASGTYKATVRAESASGAIVSAACPTVFHIGALTVTAVSNADEDTMTPGVFRVSRADADATDLPALSFDVAYSGEGVAAVAPNSATATIPAGAASVDISVVPVFTMDVTQDADLTLAVTGANIGQASSATMTVVNATFDPAIRYVATTGDDANHGGTPDFPKKTIGAAVDSLASISQTLPCTVRVAPGLYRSARELSINAPIRIVGTGDTAADVIVTNALPSGDSAPNQRVFVINHADALVANLTMQKGEGYGDGRNGGNFYIGSAGGMVSNCVSEAGLVRNNSIGAGGYLDGGVVTHTVFRGNSSGYLAESVNWSGNRAGVLVLNGTARAENCLFTENNQTKAVTLINVSGTSVMRNCTIVNSGLQVTNAYCKSWSALNISSGATVQNVVIAGVTNTVDGSAVLPTGTVAKFANGAVDGDISELAFPEGTITGTASSFFKDYANGDYTPKAGGPLVGKGANYEGMASVDLAGNPRKVGSRIDIGCYEATSTPLMIIVR